MIVFFFFFPQQSDAGDDFGNKYKKEKGRNKPRGVNKTLGWKCWLLTGRRNAQRRQDLKGASVHSQVKCSELKV